MDLEEIEATTWALNAGCFMEWSCWGKKVHLVAWPIVYFEMKFGGLSIKDIKTKNISLLKKFIWICYEAPKFNWIQAIRSNYLHEPSPHGLFTTKNLPFGSMLWNGMWKARNHTLHILKWSLGKGDQIHFWDDSWLITTPLSQLHNFNKIQQFLSQT